MNATIKTLEEKKLAGLRMTMSLANNKTPELWRSFMPRRHEIKNTKGPDLYSMQIYDPFYFKNFDPSTEFEKWATIEVADFNAIPAGIETLTLTGGLYAVFAYKGSSADTRIFRHIFGTWLPNSEYELDNRPHFEMLGEKYKNNQEDSEETIWIPVMKK